MSYVFTFIRPNLSTITISHFIPPFPLINCSWWEGYRLFSHSFMFIAKTAFSRLFILIILLIMVIVSHMISIVIILLRLHIIIFISRIISIIRILCHSLLHGILIYLFYCRLIISAASREDSSAISHYYSKIIYIFYNYLIFI